MGEGGGGGGGGGEREREREREMISPNDGVHGASKENEHLRVEEREVVEAVLPAHDGRHHEQASTAQEDHDQKTNDLGVCRSRRVGGE